MKETEDVQNIVSRLEKEMYLNLPNATTKIKTQYHKVHKAMLDLRHELDVLNDMKESFREEGE